MSMEGPRASSSGSSSNSSSNNNNNNDIGEYIKREVKEWMRMMGPVRVMTDEQIEELREQISMFGSISEQLIKMHESINARGDAIAVGTSLGSQYCDPRMIFGGAPKITVRQRWSPSVAQLKTLEAIFAQGSIVPSKQRIKEITSVLSQHGEISEANVYNWFQNRRARSRRKQAEAPAQPNMKSEAEMEKECSKIIKDKMEKISLCQCREGSSEVRPMQPDSVKTSPSVSYISDDRLKPNNSGSIGKVSFYESGLLDPRINQVMGDMELPEAILSYYQRENRYKMAR